MRTHKETKLPYIVLHPIAVLEYTHNETDHQFFVFHDCDSMDRMIATLDWCRRNSIVPTIRRVSKPARRNETNYN